VARHDTAIGHLARTDPVRWRAELVEVISRHDGFIYQAAHELGISRMHLYRMIRRANLWAEVDAARDRLIARRAELDRMIALEIPR